MRASANNGKPYRKMTDGDSEIALTDVDHREVQRPQRNTTESRIIKTTEVFTSEDSVSEDGMTAAQYQAKSQQHQQHPWMTGRG